MGGRRVWFRVRTGGEEGRREQDKERRCKLLWYPRRFPFARKLIWDSDRLDIGMPSKRRSGRSTTKGEEERRKEGGKGESS